MVRAEIRWRAERSVVHKVLDRWTVRVGMIDSGSRASE